LDIPRLPSTLHKTLAWSLAIILFLPSLLNITFAQLSGFDLRKFAVLLIDQEAYAANSLISNSDVFALLPQHLLESNWKLVILGALATLGLIALFINSRFEILAMLIAFGALACSIIFKNQIIGINLLSPNYPKEYIYSNISWLQTIALIAILASCVRNIDSFSKIPRRFATVLIAFSSLALLGVFSYKLPSLNQLEISPPNSNTIEAIAAEQQRDPEAPNILVFENFEKDSLHFSILQKPNLDYFDSFAYQQIDFLLAGESAADFQLRQSVANLISGKTDDSDYQIFIQRKIGGVEIPRAVSENSKYSEIVSALNQVPFLNLMTSTQDFAYWSFDIDNDFQKVSNE
jgi:hypothetical protein